MIRLKARKYVRDATPIAVSEPIAEVPDDVCPDALRDTIDKLRLMTSISTVTAVCKKLGLRVFIHALALPSPIDESLRAVLAGGADAIVDAWHVGLKTDVINIVSTRPEDLPKAYLPVDIGGSTLSIQGERPYGVIILNAPIDETWLIRIRERIRQRLDPKEVFIAIWPEHMNLESLRTISRIFNGIVIMEFPIVSSFYFDNEEALFVHRCVRCYADIISREELRRCPRCNSRLRPILREWGEQGVLPDKALKFKAFDELKVMKFEPPLITPI